MWHYLLNKLPVRFYKIADRRKLIGGYYHLIADDTPDYIKNLYQIKKGSEFQRDLSFLKKNYHLISYDNFLTQKFRNQSFILTFDDGFKELITQILPILEQHQIPAIFFITTSLIDNKEWMYKNLLSILIEKVRLTDEATLKSIFKDFLDLKSDSEIRKTVSNFLINITNDTNLPREIAKKMGIDESQLLQTLKPYLAKDEIVALSKHPLITVGAHSTQHFHYKFLDQKEIKEDIITSCKIIQSITNQPKVPFAFPHNSENVSRDLLREIELENPEIKGFFGEFNFEKQDMVIKRFSLDHPQNEVGIVIKREGKNHWYRKLKF